MRPVFFIAEQPCGARRNPRFCTGPAARVQTQCAFWRMRLAEAGQISQASPRWPSRSLAPVIFLDRRAAARCGRPPTTPARRSTPSARGVRFQAPRRAGASRGAAARGRRREPRGRGGPVECGRGGGATQDAQLAREIVLALPANAELTTEDRIELARRFAIENFVSKGLAVQLDVHAPHAGDLGERARQLACASPDHDAACGRGGVFGEEVRDLEPEIKRIGRAVVSEGRPGARSGANEPLLRRTGARDPSRPEKRGCSSAYRP